MDQKFISNILNIYGNNGQKWLDELPRIVQSTAKEWSLSQLNPVENLSMNYVLMGIKGESEIILKLSLDESLMLREMTALKYLRNYGAVEVLAYKPKTLLLKKLSPATSLKSYLPSRKAEALQIACNVAKNLLSAPSPIDIKLPSIEERFNPLDKDWPIPNNHLILARKFRDEVFKSQHIRKVLHGDLHHDNILQDRKTWKIIDPHGVIGFPINEVWSFVQDIEEDIPFIAHYFNFDPILLKKCYFMHIILSSLWAIEDNLNPEFWLEQAKKVIF